MEKSTEQKLEQNIAKGIKHKVLTLNVNEAAVGHE